MASTPQPTYPSEAELIQWLNELDTRQRVALRLYLVKKFKQTEAATRLGMTQSSFSTYYNKTIERLNNKARAAHRDVPISDSALASALEMIPESPQEQAELVGAAIAGTHDEVTNNQPNAKSGGLEEIQQNTAAQPTAAARPSVIRSWGVPLGALVVGLILGALAISRSGTPAALSPMAEPQVINATVIVPETVIVRETELIPVTVVVEQTVPVPQTVVVEQTVLVPQTVVVTVLATEAQQAGVGIETGPLITGSNEATPQEITPEPTLTETPAPPEGVTAPGTVLFSDDFDVGPSSAWTPESGDWNMRNGKLVNTGPRGMMWLGKQNWTDVVVDFDTNNAGCNGETHVLVRMQDLNNYVGYKVIGCHTHMVYLVKDGKSVKDIVVVESGAGHHRLEVIGNIYRVYQDGRLIGTGSDNTFKDGSVGILIDRSAQELDNFKVAVPE